VTAAASASEVAIVSASAWAGELPFGLLKELFYLFEALADALASAKLVVFDDHRGQFQSCGGEIGFAFEEIDKLDGFGGHLLRENGLEQSALLLGFDLA